MLNRGDQHEFFVEILCGYKAKFGPDVHMKKVVIFIGPSLPKETVQKLVPDALVLAPAEQGDIDFAARQLGAEVIGFIDGVHRNKLPSWHSEILSALEGGTRILGAASMGALRAVECRPWGRGIFW